MIYVSRAISDGRHDMFTGIIEEIGIVKQLVPGKVSYRLTVSANKVLEGV